MQLTSQLYTKFGVGHFECQCSLAHSRRTVNGEVLLDAVQLDTPTNLTRVADFIFIDSQWMPTKEIAANGVHLDM